jgi:hypothetical protein
MHSIRFQWALDCSSNSWNPEVQDGYLNTALGHCTPACSTCFLESVSVCKDRPAYAYGVAGAVGDWSVDWLIDRLWRDETMSLNCGQQWAYCSSPGWYVSMEIHGGSNSWLVQQSSLAVLPAQTSGAMDEGMRILPTSFWNTSRNLTTWDLRLCFPSEGRCAADFNRP